MQSTYCRIIDKMTLFEEAELWVYNEMLFTKWRLCTDFPLTECGPRNESNEILEGKEEEESNKHAIKSVNESF